VYLVGFTIKKFVTMHGHMNVKQGGWSRCSQWYSQRFLCL